MSTPCESVYDVFFDLIEEDRDFGRTAGFCNSTAALRTSQTG